MEFILLCGAGLGASDFTPEFLMLKVKSLIDFFKLAFFQSRKHQAITNILERFCDALLSGEGKSRK